MLDCIKFPHVELKVEREITEHLINLFEKSKGELNGQEQTHLRELLCDFEDVLAKNEFDLGKFNAIQHGIDTGSNHPAKHRIRRTPLGFAREGTQLKKMLIRPSVGFFKVVNHMFGYFPFYLLLDLLFCNLYFLYSYGLHLRTHLFCIGQHFPLFQFYMVIG
jgi:hypothetical protein